MSEDVRAEIAQILFEASEDLGLGDPARYAGAVFVDRLAARIVSLVREV